MLNQVRGKLTTGNVLAKSKKLQIELFDESDTQQDIQRLVQQFSKSSPRYLKKGPSKRLMSSTPKAMTIYSKKQSVKSNSVGGTPKNKSSQKIKGRRLFFPSGNQWVLQKVNKLVRAQLPLQKYPKFNQTLKRLPSRVFKPVTKNLTIKRKTSRKKKLNEYVTKINPEQQEQLTSEQMYRQHLLSTFNSLRFIKQLSDVDQDQLRQKTVHLSKPKEHLQHKTLILDLDETLVHCVDDADNSKSDIVLPVTFPDGEVAHAGLNIRPYAIDCLKYASQNFELIIFTASHQCYADTVLDYLDPDGTLIDSRLYRDSCVLIEGAYIKDLRILSERNLKDIIIVDNATHSFAYQLDNGIPIISWYDDKQDEELLNLISYLDILKETEDVREVNRETFHLDTFFEDYINEYFKDVND